MIREYFIDNSEKLVTDGHFNVKCLFTLYVLGKCIITQYQVNVPSLYTHKVP